MAEQLLFDKSLKNIQFPFRVTGLNISNKKRSRVQNCVFIFNFLWHLTDLQSATWFVLYGVYSGQNFIDLTAVAPCMIFGILADFRAIIFLYKENKILSLIDSLRELEIRARKLVNSDTDILVAPEVNLLNITVKLFNIFNVLMVLLFDVCPVIFIGIKYFMTGKSGLLLPFLDVYPFNAFDMRIWPFAYAHQFWSVCVSLLEVCAVDFFFYTCCTHIKIEFKLLKHQFQEIIKVKTIAAIEPADQMAIQERFKELIKWHQEIIRCANMLEAIYSKCTLLNYLASSVMICLTGFNVTVSEDKKFVVQFIAFLFVAMLQVFFLCLFGDFLMRSSMDITDSVYNSRWYLTDMKMRKNILLVQVKAQRPCKLTAAGFADINLNAYMKILSTSWSYFALLQTIYSGRT